MEKNISRFLASVFLIVAISFSVFLIAKSQQIQYFKADHAQLNNIEHGLFNVHEWKRKVANLISEKISTFELTPFNEDEIKNQIEGALNNLFDDVESNIQKEAENSLLGSLKGGFIDMFIDKDELRSNIPEYADQIIVEFSKEENRAELTKIIEEKLQGLLEEEVGEEDRSVIQFLLSKYEHTTIKGFNTDLIERIKLGQNELWVYSGAIIMSFIILFLLVHGNLKSVENWSYFLVLGGILVLLITGVTTPMIDIDARIEHIELDFMGSPLEFNDQILFFQSKSILDVVILLFKNGGFQTILVGFLILLFSILFPVSKLISTYLVLKKPQLREKKILNFLSFYSGKWSMADVFVVAIFMAYIGFNSILENQMDLLQNSSGNAQIMSTNETSLQPGFLLFIVFTLSGLYLSFILFKQFKTKN